jgi:hypothetical protein
VRIVLLEARRTAAQREKNSSTQDGSEATQVATGTVSPNTHHDDDTTVPGPPTIRSAPAVWAELPKRA